MNTPSVADSTSPPSDSTSRWGTLTRIAFRFGCVYFGLYVLTTQMLSSLIPLPVSGLPELGVTPPARNVFLWVGRHILGIAAPISYRMTGSGDKLFDWVQTFSLLIIAALVTAAWSALARRNENTERLYPWFRLVIRFALGTTLLTYGLDKVPPMQMPILSLQYLVRPFGEFTPMDVLWSSIGASPAYEVFVGLAEVGAALLLFMPRTVALGALLCLMDTIEVFTLNMTYDVPVKLFAFHLIVMSLVLIAPNATRYRDLFLRGRGVVLIGEPAVASMPRRRRAATIAQVVFGTYVLLLGIYTAVGQWKTLSGGAPRSALFGIWNVDQITVDGASRAALLTDSTRWRRIFFQGTTYMNYQLMNDAINGYPSTIDTVARTITLTARDSAKTKSTWTYQRPTKERLILDGPMSGQQFHVELSYRDPDSFRQRSRRFHWIQEFPRSP